MLRLRPMNPDFPIEQQLAVGAGPVVLVNTFTVAPEDVDQLLAAWEADATWMKKQPGFISTQLHRALGPSPMFLNYAVWETTAHFTRAFTNPEFQASLAAYPDSAVASPHLFQKVAVPNMCVA